MPFERHTVLVLVKGLGIGGAERLILAAASHWDRTRFDYHVAYLLPWKDQLVPGLTELGVPTTCIGSGRDMSPVTPIRLRRAVRTLGADLVHAHLPVAGVMARIAAKVPVVYTEHNIVSSYRLPTRILNRITYGKNAAVTAVSEAVAESLSGYPGPDPIIVENGVSEGGAARNRAQVRSELGLGDGNPLVVHVGNIRPHKGHQTLIRTAERVARIRDDVRFISIGGEKHSGDLQRLRTQVSRLGLENTIRFLGREDDALSYMAACDLYVNPSDVEGLPVSILEAQALGKPVVATRVGGVPSVVTDGVTGRLVEPDDPDRLATTMLEVLGSSDRGHSLGEKAREMVRKRYGIQRMVRRFEDLYQAMLSHR